LPGATRTIGLGLCLVDLQGATVHLEAVEALDGARRIGVRHFHEAEATRLAGVTVGDEGDGLDRAVLSEQRADRGFVGRKRPVTKVDLAH